MKSLRTAVVGLGRIGWPHHVPQVLKHDGFELVAVADPVQERLDEAKSEVGVKGYLDYEKLLDAEQPDLVVLASPTRFHSSQAAAAFAHGCDVFCDKPMAPSLEEADRMIDAMKTSGRKLMIYQPQRGGSTTVALREIMNRGLIGPVYMIKAARTAYTRRNDWQAFRKHGGGMLNNYGAHMIDALLYLSGSRVKRVSCMLRTVASLGDADDVVKAVIETESGMILDVDINMASAHPMPMFHVLGAHGSLIFDWDRGWQAKYYRPEELADIPVDNGLAAPGRRYNSGEKIPWREETFSPSDFQSIDFYAKCYDYFALDGEPFVPVEESRELMRVLDACRKDAEGGML